MPATTRPAMMRPAPNVSTDWRDLAACRDSDPELFFPVGNAGPALVQLDRAKQVCAGCTVRVTCLEWALASGEDAGVGRHQRGRAARATADAPG